MKQIVKLLLIATCSPSFFSSFPSGRVFASMQPQDAVQLIRQQYVAINKRASRYKKVKKELSGLSLEGGELVAYFDGPAVVKVVATHYGEMGRSVDEYYYSSGKLIFVFEKVLHYNKPMSGKVVRTAEDRYYFADDKLIRWIDENGKLADTADDAGQSKQKEILENSNLFTAGVRTKKPIIEK